jgi:hypothetical protein
LKTAYQAGFARFENGELLSRAAKDFDVMVTTDKNIKSQQNLMKLPLPVVEFAAADTRIEGLPPFAPYCDAALEQTVRYRFVSIRMDGSLELLAPF